MSALTSLGVPPRRHPSAAPRGFAAEPLEPRVLLSNIVWTNRGGAGGSGSDTDNFAAMYGSQAGAARAIVDLAISYWSQIIVDFNWDPDDDITQYSLDISAGQLAQGTRAETSGIDDDGDDTPYGADIVMDDDGGGGGWFVDATPAQNEEFTVVDRDTGVPTSSLGGFDFLRTIGHEMGHAFGFSELADFLESDDLKIGDYLIDAGTDQIDDDGDLYVLVPPGYSESNPLVTFTDAGGLHVYEGAPDPDSDFPDAEPTPNDLMNGGRAIQMGTRQYPSDLDATILGAVYGYDIKLPSTIAGANFLTAFDPSTGVLTVNGDPESNGDDSITISRSGGAIAVQINLSQMLFDASALTQIVLNPGAGADILTVNSSAGNPYPDDGIIFTGGDDDDSVLVFGPQVPTVYTISATDVQVGSGTLTYTAEHLTVVADSDSADNGFSVLGTDPTLQDLLVVASAGDDAIRLEGVSAATDVEIDALAGLDAFFIGLQSADLDAVNGQILLNGGEDDDTLAVFDQSNGNDNQYLIGPGGLVEGAFLRNTDLTVLFNEIEGLEFHAGDGYDGIRITGTPPNTFVQADGGFGGDLFFVDSESGPAVGTVNQVVQLLDLNGGAGGSDLLVLDDSADADASQLYVTDTLVRSLSPGSFFGAGGGVDYDGFEQLTISMGSGDDAVNLRGTSAATTTIIHAGEGDDVAVVDGDGPATPGGNVNAVTSQVYLHGEGGHDDLRLDDSSDGVGDTLTLTEKEVGAEPGDTFFGAGGALNYGGFESLRVDLGQGADDVNVRATNASTPVEINTGDGEDDVAVDSNGAHAGGDVAGVNSALTVHGQAGGARVTLENSGGTLDGDFVTITNSTVGAGAGDEFFGAGGGLFYGGLNTLTVNTSHGPDAAIVRGTASGTVTHVNGNGGDDGVTVNSLGSGAAGTADIVVSTLAVDGGSGVDAVTVDDAGDATPDSVVVTATGVLGCFGAGGSLTYAGVQTLTLNLGSGGDAVNVQSTAAGTATTVNAGGGDDAFGIDSNGAAAGGTVDGIVSLLTVNGQAGTNTLALEDSGDTTADVVTVNATRIGAGAGDSLFGVGGSVAFSGIGAVTLSMTSAVLGDVVYLTPSATTAFTVLGNAPTGPDNKNGDSLVFDLAGITARKFDKLGKGAGTWSVDGRQPVTFYDVEVVSNSAV